MISRGEFESFRDGVSNSFEALHDDIEDQGRRFDDGLRQQSSDIKDLVRARQVSWPLIASIVGLALVVLSSGIRTANSVSSLETAVAALTASNDNLRERTRSLETGLRADKIEGESQNRWMADVMNLQFQTLDRLVRTSCSVDRAHPLDVPDIDYWPLGQIGRAESAGRGEGQ